MYLCIEDSEGILQILSGITSKIALVTNCDDALDPIRSGKYRVIFLDYHGVARNNVGPREVAQLAKTLGIQVILTSSDKDQCQAFLELYGIQSISKTKLFMVARNIELGQYEPVLSGLGNPKRAR